MYHQSTHETHAGSFFICGPIVYSFSSSSPSSSSSSEWWPASRFHARAQFVRANEFPSARFIYTTFFSSHLHLLVQLASFVEPASCLNFQHILQMNSPLPDLSILHFLLSSLLPQCCLQEKWFSNHLSFGSYDKLAILKAKLVRKFDIFRSACSICYRWLPSSTY